MITSVKHNNSDEKTSDSLYVTSVIMAYNEVNTLESTVRELYEVLREARSSFEILIIDDGSDDGTGELADEISISLSEVRVIHHPSNKGLGGVYRTGFTGALGKNITFFPADYQIPASALNKFLPMIEHYDMVLGYLPSRNASLLSKFFSFSERIMYRVLFGYFPRFQGSFMFRRSLLNEIQLISKGRGWTLVMELIVKTHRTGFKIISVPIDDRPRVEGGSKVNNLRTIWANFKELIHLFFTM